jgi:putative nucleotidyltransferase with HDIG domain
MQDARNPSKPAGEMRFSASAKVFIGVTLALGLATLVHAGIIWPQSDVSRFAFYAAVAAFAAGLKVRLPGSEATLSVTFFFQLLAAVELGFSQAVTVSAVGGIIQTCWRPHHRPQVIQVLFSSNALALSAGCAALAFDAQWVRGLGFEFTARVALATSVLFLTNNLLVGAIVSLTQGKRLWVTLKSFSWYFPYYLAAAIVVGLFHVLSQAAGWQTALLSLPAVYVIYRTYQGQIDRVEAHSRHVEQMAALHVRTIESLALAIECKDATTHEHLGRVQVYALEVGLKLGLGELELEAIRAGSLLHDIGKLAVPEHIINKPGRLTPEEFEKMKIHPVVGAEILETVQFPYPVVPIVRSHHEKWDCRRADPDWSTCDLGRRLPGCPGQRQAVPACPAAGAGDGRRP